ncbi:hypothetical protein OROMI_007857 [Orobanche minor]
MPTSQPPSAATPNSQSIPDENSQPSTTPELQIQSAPTGILIHEPDVITITDEGKQNKLLKKGKSKAWLHFDKVLVDGVLKAQCNYCSAKLRGDSGAGTSHLNSHYETKHHSKELDHYLDEDVVQKDGFDLLNWWKANEQKYPTLQLMARDFLAIPASTVASESAFSSSGRLVSPHRNRLHPKTLEALMCAQSWLWAAEMKGQASTGYATIYQDQESEDSCITRMKKESTYGLLVVAKSKVSQELCLMVLPSASEL